MTGDPLTEGGTETTAHAQGLMDAAHSRQAELESRCADAMSAAPPAGDVAGFVDIPVNDAPPPAAWRNYPGAGDQTLP